MEQNRFKRLWRHWLSPRRRVERHFPTSDLQRLSREIGASEQNHRGQVRFVIESHYPASAVWNRVEPRTRALQWFGELGVWDTEENSGVLVYVSFADRVIEIVVDRGIAAKIDQPRWQDICDTMRRHFLNGDYVNGLEQGLRETDRLLVQHFPRFQTASTDELPNDVVLK